MFKIIFVTANFPARPHSTALLTKKRRNGKSSPAAGLAFVGLARARHYGVLVVMGTHGKLDMLLLLNAEKVQRQYNIGGSYRDVEKDCCHPGYDDV